jgi:hypothetical protein
MARESKDTVKKSIGIDAQTYVWIMNFASRYRIDYTAAVNLLLVQAIERIELMEAAERRSNEALMDSLKTHEVIREQGETRERPRLSRVDHMVQQAIEKREVGVDDE